MCPYSINRSKIRALHINIRCFTDTHNHHMVWDPTSFWKQFQTVEVLDEGQRCAVELVQDQNTFPLFVPYVLFSSEQAAACPWWEASLSSEPAAHQSVGTSNKSEEPVPTPLGSHHTLNQWGHLKLLGGIVQWVLHQVRVVTASLQQHEHVLHL